MIIVINDSSSLSSSCNANTSSVSTRKPPPANMFVGLALAYIVIDIIIIFVIINLRNITFPFFVKWSLLVWFETSQSDCESLWHLGRGLASKWNDTNRIPPCYHCIPLPPLAILSHPPAPACPSNPLLVNELNLKSKICLSKKKREDAKKAYVDQNEAVSTHNSAPGISRFVQTKTFLKFRFPECFWD